MMTRTQQGLVLGACRLLDAARVASSRGPGSRREVRELYAIEASLHRLAELDGLWPPPRREVG